MPGGREAGKGSPRSHNGLSVNQSRANVSYPRFTPTGPDTIEWSIRFEDAHTWARPWSFGMRLTRDPESRAVEYACHEGNEGLRNMLKVARHAEKAGPG